MKTLKPLFFLIGVGAYLAAGIIVFATRKENPFSQTPKWLLANPKYDGLVRIVEFSPDGKELAFEVRNETGELSAYDIYLYTIDEKKVRKLNIENAQIFTGWAPDSRRLTFIRRKPHNPYLYDGYVYDTEQDAIVEKFNLPFVRCGWSPNDGWQLFRHPITGVVYVKEIGKPQWLQLPKEIIISYWSRDGASLIGFNPERTILYQFDLAEQSLNILTRFDEYPVRPLLYCSPYANEVFALAYKQPEDHGCTILEKINTDTGQITFFDTGLDPKTTSLDGVFIPREENFLYFKTYQYRVDGKPVGEPPKLVLLNMKTGEMETVLSGGYRFCDYCGLRDMFAVTSPEDEHKKLYLFDVRTKSFEEIFPHTE